jgi:hypothetical protein
MAAAMITPENISADKVLWVTRAPSGGAEIPSADLTDT